MPKIKTTRGAAKRFKLTGTGKLKRHKAYLRHQLTAKTRKAKRHLRQAAIVHPTNTRAIRRMAPYL